MSDSLIAQAQANCLELRLGKIPAVSTEDTRALYEVVATLNRHVSKLGNFVGQAGSAMVAGTFVAISPGSDIAILSPATATSKQTLAVGAILADVALGSQVVVRTGGIVDVQLALIPGTYYYISLSQAGGITEVMPGSDVQCVGFAVSTSQLFVRLNQ